MDIDVFEFLFNENVEECFMLMTQTLFQPVNSQSFRRSCALEYERRQEMAAASLAFKCIEVAYLRIVYHKHSSINGDRLEMNSFRSIVQGNRKKIMIFKGDKTGFVGFFATFFSSIS